MASIMLHKQKKSKTKVARTGLTGQVPASDTIVALRAKLTKIRFIDPRVPLPDRYRCVMHSTFVLETSAASAATDGNALGYLWKANSVIEGVTTNYPIGTLSGATATVPAGLKYLLGSGGTAGASPGIYQGFCVHANEIDVELTNPVTTGSGDAIQVVLVPYGGMLTTATSMVTAALAEQPNALRAMMNVLTEGQPLRLRHRMRSAEMLGSRFVDNMFLPGSAWCGDYNTDPTDPWYWELRMNNVGGGTGTNKLGVRVTVSYDVEFFMRNTLSVSAPSVSTPAPQERAAAAAAASAAPCTCACSKGYEVV